MLGTRSGWEQRTRAATAEHDVEGRVVLLLEGLAGRWGLGERNVVDWEIARTRLCQHVDSQPRVALTKRGNSQP